MAEDTRSPSLIEVLEVATAAAAAGLHVMLPARVAEYDAARQVARVRPLVGSTRVDGDGVEHEELYPDVVEVPVEWLGGGGARLLFPLQAQDFGLIVFSDRSLDEWKVNRGVQPLIPKDPRNHALQDAVFRPGLRPPSNPWTGARTNAVTLGYADEQGQGMQLHITPAGMALGEPTPAYAVALAEKVQQELTALRNTVAALVAAYNGHTHLVATTGSASAQTGTAAATGATATQPASVQAVGSTTVKVKP